MTFKIWDIHLHYKIYHSFEPEKMLIRSGVMMERIVSQVAMSSLCCLLAVLLKIALFLTCSQALSRNHQTHLRYGSRLLPLGHSSLAEDTFPGEKKIIFSQ